jgi:hypothetical protein
MLSSVDGKIDSAALEAVTGKDEYEATGAKLNSDAWICGRTSRKTSFSYRVRTIRQDLSPFMSIGGRNPMPSCG